MTERDLQQRALQWSDELRKAIVRGDQKDAVDVFATSTAAVDVGESAAVTALLIGELVQ